VGQHGRDDEPGRRHEQVGEQGERHHPLRLDARLLLRLPQGGGHGVGVVGIGAPTGEGDLAGVLAQGAGSLDEQHVRPVPSLVAEEHQHGGAPPVGGWGQAVAHQLGGIDPLDA
jgi:hypothetical protein